MISSLSQMKSGTSTTEERLRDSMKVTGMDKILVAIRYCTRGLHPNLEMSANPATHKSSSMAPKAGQAMESRMITPTQLPSSLGILR